MANGNESKKLLKRSEVAKRLGVSVSTLRRREGELLKPIVGADGVHLFDEEEVRAVSITLRRRQIISPPGRATATWRRRCLPCSTRTRTQ
jgi:hypothetical protein